MVLSSHGERESRLGSATVVNITILKNDEPHGVIDFVSDGLTVSIKESKGEDIYNGKLYVYYILFLFTEEDINLFSP